MNRVLRATDGARTRDPNLGKVVLYQLSHCRMNIKALSEEKEEETEELHVELPKSEEIGTNLGDLFKNIKL